MDMLNVYKVYSEFISNSIAINGEIATKYAIVRSMRAVKEETLKLMQACSLSICISPFLLLEGVF
jgi:exportin-1